METKAKEKKLQVASPGTAAVGNGSAAGEGEAETVKSLEEKKEDWEGCDGEEVTRSM